MLGALLSALDGGDKAVVTLTAVAITGLIHAIAYTTADGALRPPRLLLRRSADVLVVAATIFLIRLWLTA